LQGTAIHGNIGDTIRRVHAVIGQELRFNGRRQPFVLATVEGLSALGRPFVEGSEFVHTELATKREDVQLVEDALDHSCLVRHSHERRAAIWAVECLHVLG